MKRYFEFLIVMELGRSSSEDLLNKLKSSNLEFTNFRHYPLNNQVYFASVCKDESRDDAEESLWEYIELQIGEPVLSVSFMGCISHEEYSLRY